MGNVFAINVNIPLDEMLSCCWRRTCSSGESFRSLQKDWVRLRAAKNDVRKKIEFQERQEGTMLEAVGEWLQQVEAIEAKVNELESEHSLESASKCFFGYCPRNFKTRYTFGKNVANLQKEVDSLLERKPDEVAQNILQAQHADRPIGPTIGLESMLDKVWRYFEDVQVGTIGLYGMGGVGKTTLLKVLNNKLCQSTKRFDVVFWIVVSTNPNFTIIQNGIGKKLGFYNDNWKEKRQEEKAEDIYNVLKGKKYVLFLDDVWKRFDLLELGIPLPNQLNESKVVLTTRSYQVCGNMGVDMSIQVTCLGEEESWNLFKKTVGEKVINAHEDIQEIAKLVAKECDGLPLALIVIGQTMSIKETPRAWNTALYRLKKYTAEFTGMGDNILPLLKFSYDSIQNVAIKSCFLYCSLYPEDYLIPKEEILDKWICEGFLDTFADLHEARNEGYDYMDTLVNACLLEESSPSQIKMHDIIREMAIWIACECGERKDNFFVRAGVGLTETPDVVEFEGSEKTSLMRNEIKKLTGKPNCPNMLTLFLDGTVLNHIDNEFFQSMPKLKVLDLSSNFDLMEIPEGVCNLFTLQYLNLSFTTMSKLPTNLHNLINLKWMSIRSNRNVTQLPKGLLYSCKKLQVLDLYNTKVGLHPTFVEESESLKHFADLRIQLVSQIDFSRFSSSHKLASITTSLCVTEMTSTNLDLLVTHKMVNLRFLLS